MASSKNNSGENSEAKKPAAPAKKKETKKAAAKKGDKPSLKERAVTYFKGVKSEIKRVTWPTKDELVKYTAAVIGMLIFFGILIAVVDAVVVPALYAFQGLR